MSDIDLTGLYEPDDVPVARKPPSAPSGPITTGVPTKINSMFMGLKGRADSRMDTIRAQFPNVPKENFWADPETGETVTVKDNDGKVYTYFPPDVGHAFAGIFHPPTEQDFENRATGKKDLTARLNDSNLAASIPELGANVALMGATGGASIPANMARAGLTAGGTRVLREMLAKATPGGSRETAETIGARAGGEGIATALISAVPGLVQSGGNRLLAMFGNKAAQNALRAEALGIKATTGYNPLLENPGTGAMASSVPEVAQLVKERAEAYAQNNLNRVHEINAQLEDWANPILPNPQNVRNAVESSTKAPSTPAGAASKTSNPEDEEVVNAILNARDAHAKSTAPSVMQGEPKTAAGVNVKGVATKPVKQEEIIDPAIERAQQEFMSPEGAEKQFAAIAAERSARAAAAKAAQEAMPGTKIFLPASKGLGGISPKATEAVADILSDSPAARSVETELAAKAKGALEAEAVNTGFKPEVEAATRNAAETAANKANQRVQGAKQGVGKAKANLDEATREANLNDKELQAIARSNVLDKTEAARAASATEAEKLTPSVLKKEKEAGDELFRAKIDLARHKNDIPTAEHGLDAERSAVRDAQGDLNAAQNQKLLTSQKGAEKLAPMEGKTFDPVKAEQSIAKRDLAGIAAQRSRATGEKLGSYSEETIRTLKRDGTPESARLVKLNEFAKEFELASEKVKAAKPDDSFLKVAIKYGKRATIIGAIPSLVGHMPKKMLRQAMEDPKILASFYEALEKGIPPKTIVNQFSGTFGVAAPEAVKEYSGDE